MSLVKVLSRFARCLWLLLAALLIGSALLVVLTRLLLPLANNYRAELSQSLSDASGLNIEVGRVSGTWQRFSPTLSFGDVSLWSQQGDHRGVKIGHISAEIAPLRSLLSQEIIWQELRVDNVVVNTEEDAYGNWFIAGVPLQGEVDSDASFKILDMLFYSQFINVDEVSLELDFYSGSLWSIELRDILVENSVDFHRILARVITERGDEAARLIVEGRGDYSSADDFQIDGYLRLREVGLTPKLHALAKDIFPHQVEKIGGFRASLDAEFWFDIDGQGKTDFVGKLTSNEIPLPWLDEPIGISHLQSDLVGWFDPGREWGVRLQNLGFQWLNQPIAPLNVEFTQSLGKQWGDFSAFFDHINLATASEILIKTGLLNEPATDVIAQLSPHGRITALDIDISNRSEKPLFTMAGNLENVSVQPWTGAPGINNLNGYVTASPGGGSVFIDAENIDFLYDTIYDQPIFHSQVVGQVDWLWDENSSRVAVISDDLNLGSNMGEITAHLYLDIPVGQKEQHPSMFLQVGVKNSHSKYLPVLLPNNLSGGLTHWLNNGLKEVDISQLAVVYRGEFEDPKKRTVQIATQVVDGQIVFHKEWPTIERVKAEVYVNDGEVDGTVQQGFIAGVGVNHAAVRLREQRGVQHLFINAGANPTINQAFALLRQSPLGKTVEQLNSWAITGATETKVTLDIPIDAPRESTGNTAQPVYSVSARIKNSSITNKHSGLKVDHINSILEFNERDGFYSKKLRGELWRQPVYGDIVTRPHGLEINTNMRWDISKLKEEFGIVGDTLSGEVDLQGTITLPNASQNVHPTVVYRSNLKNTVIDLPAPLAKKSGDIRNLLVDVEMADEKIILNLTLGDKLFLGAELSDGALLRGVLTHNRSLSNMILPRNREFLISLQGETLDIASWQEAIGRILDENSFSSEDSSLPVKIDMELEYLSLAGFDLDKVGLRGTLLGDEFEALFSSAQISGRVKRPQADAGNLLVDLAYLKLPKASAANKSSQTATEKESSAFDPRTIPNMDFSAKEIFYGEKLLGNAAFTTNSDEAGLTVTNIEADLFGFLLGKGEKRASIEWLFDGAHHSTHFDGIVRTESVGDVQENMDLPRAMEAESAKFDADISWPGRPWDGDIKAIQGDLDLALKKGHFDQSSSKSASTIMRLIGLLNTGEWLRRLKFDFSDVFSKGISFTEITGRLYFDGGIMTAYKPIETKMASGKMQVTGEVNLITEDLDTQIVMTLPVGTNLPWVTAMIGSLPAVAGVYLFNKVFKKQVDKLSSVTYSLKGQWSDPEVEVVKIFSDNKKSGLSVPKLKRSDTDRNKKSP